MPSTLFGCIATSDKRWAILFLEAGFYYKKFYSMISSPACVGLFAFITFGSYDSQNHENGYGNKPPTKNIHDINGNLLIAKNQHQRQANDPESQNGAEHKNELIDNSVRLFVFHVYLTMEVEVVFIIQQIIHHHIINKIPIKTII